MEQLKTEKFMHSIAGVIEGYITVCPLCGEVCSDYFCRGCQMQIEPEKISKEDFVLDRAIRWFV